MKAGIAGFFLCLVAGLTMPGLATQAMADCVVKAPPGLVSGGALTVGSNMSTPPQMYIDKGEPAGFEIDLAKAIAAKMCLKPVLVNIAFGGLFPGLAAHKFDYITSGLGITPQREQVFDWVPYLVGGIQLVARKDSNLSFRNENDLCGHSVATISGTTQAKALERANQTVCKPGKMIDFKYFPSFNDAVMQLRKKSADVAFVDWAFASYVTGLMPELKTASPIIAGRPEVPRNKLGLAFRKGDKPMVDAVNAALAALEKSGEYDKLLDKWRMRQGDIRKPA
ncbi:MAG TPA: ABC transporter substrate-binding protein [Rhizomicrobium sp.]|jgi:polar amino acid transport system substrate-binding protein|nr:ABC transporter substrate-binding protein [Rhizomicrobium sp.]